MNAVRAFVSRHTDMLTRVHSSNTRKSVASPVSSCSLQTNPSEASATAFTGASPSANGFNCAESKGALRRPMLIWASSYAASDEGGVMAAR